jgi:predicted  nucleic acid-binding Zn-ribbon protein
MHCPNCGCEKTYLARTSEQLWDQSEELVEAADPWLWGLEHYNYCNNCGTRFDHEGHRLVKVWSIPDRVPGGKE